MRFYNNPSNLIFYRGYFKLAKKKDYVKIYTINLPHFVQISSTLPSIHLASYFIRVMLKNFALQSFYLIFYKF